MAAPASSATASRRTGRHWRYAQTAKQAVSLNEQVTISAIAIGGSGGLSPNSSRFPEGALMGPRLCHPIERALSGSFCSSEPAALSPYQVLLLVGRAATSPYLRLWPEPHPLA